MDKKSRKKHWEQIYTTKPFEEVSWYQPYPQVSMNYLNGFELAKDASIIDVGGGDSFLVDALLDQGYTDITVLDISAKALDRAQQRLGEKARQVKWIVTDILDFVPTQTYDVWHDRAVFHFLTHSQEQQLYASLAATTVAENGSLVLGVFSDQGPKRCSGIDIQQYSEATIEMSFKDGFKKLFSERLVHPTPFDTTQEFLFTGFSRSTAKLPTR